MKLTIRVATVAEVEAARNEAAALLGPEDELEILVGDQQSAKPVETQPLRQAVGHRPTPR